MKFYWMDTIGGVEENQPLYCVGVYCNDLNEGFMKLSTNKEEKLDDEVVLTFINKYDDITGKYETSDYVFYADLDIIYGDPDNKTHGIFFEFLKDYKR